MRRVGLVTVGRSDYGIYMPILQIIKSSPELQLELLVAGMHLSPEFGQTVGQIEADGFDISERVEMLLSSDSPEGIAKSMGLGGNWFCASIFSSKLRYARRFGGSFRDVCRGPSCAAF